MARRSAFRIPAGLLLVFSLWIALAATARASGTATAASSPASPPAASSAPSSDQALRQRFESLQSATVGVKVRAIEGASSIRTLGREREGTGVVIAPMGLVLTIGYLIVEADQVQITTREQAQVPAQVVAYDAVTGLGLLKPLFPLPGARQVKLGSAFAAERGLPLLALTGSAPRQAAVVRLVDIRPFTGYWEYHLDTALYTAPAFANHSGAGLFNVEGELVGTMDWAGTSIPVERFSPGAPDRTTRGEIGAMALYAGRSVEWAREVKPARDIVVELIGGAEELLRAATSTIGER